ncbi:MAG TPA: sugar-transfer associated ATP-grasp domain-containing protein, partial [Chitinophagaceae bacterium]|nr:sugar-transfer associated ATP-grasp domain-containing protein [Chitinophagaceae bacterium]
RMVTLRWKGDIHYLLTFARFGANNSVKDNAGTGGVCIGINEKGEFFDTAIDANACLHTIHPTTGYKFKSLTRIENFDTFKQFVIYLHHQVIHHDFISWDIAVDHNSEPVFIEANFAGATWLYQFASKQPLFGDLTEEILQTISPMKNKRYRNVQVRSKKRRRSSIKSLKNNLKKQRQEVITLKERNKKIKSNSRKLKLDLKSKNIKIKQLNEEIEKLKGEINQIKNSKSWRYTAIFRRKK